MAAITKRPQGYVVARVDGAGTALLNGHPIGTEPTSVGHGDMLEIGGIQMEFVQA